MTKIDIISGFLGAGKTTLIKKLLREAFQNEQVVLIENEFGEIGIDGGFLREAGIEIREMNSGCICCSLVGDFGQSLREVISQYHPDRILIEPSGVGKLSDVIKAVQGVQEETGLVLNSYTTVVDAKKCKMYMRNFGEFFNNQVEYAGAIILSRTDLIDEERAEQCRETLRQINGRAAIITTPIEELDGAKILEVMERPVSLQEELLEEESCPVCGHIHGHDHEHRHDHPAHGHDHPGHSVHNHEHDHDHEDSHDHSAHDHEHGHDHLAHGHDHPGHSAHDHDHDHEDSHDHPAHEHGHDHPGHSAHDHEHDHDHEHSHAHHDHGHCCGHDHHHHADEVFTSWGRETVKKYTKDQLQEILDQLSSNGEYGVILRAKGMLPVQDGAWIYFDMVPEETEIREGAPEYTGRVCVIGSKLQEDKLEELFGL